MPFNLFKKRKLVYRSSPWRFFALVCIGFATIWAFWQNSQRQMNILKTHENIRDELLFLNDRERDGLSSMISEFCSKYAIDVKMEITEQPFMDVDKGKPVIYMGINPRNGEILVTLPPLLKKALGENLIQKLVDEELYPQILKQAYADAFASALRRIWVELGKLE